MESARGNSPVNLPSVRAGVVNYVALATTCLEVIGVFAGARTEREFHAVKGNLVVPGLGGHAIADAGDHHIRSQKPRVVRRCESPIRREARYLESGKNFDPNPHAAAPTDRVSSFAVSVKFFEGSHRTSRRIPSASDIVSFSSKTLPPKMSRGGTFDRRQFSSPASSRS